jgi:hypothetical protein
MKLVYRIAFWTILLVTTLVTVRFISPTMNALIALNTATAITSLIGICLLYFFDALVLVYCSQMIEHHRYEEYRAMRRGHP